MVDPLVIKRGKHGNRLRMKISIGKSSTHGGFSIAMFDCQRVSFVNLKSPLMIFIRVHCLDFNYFIALP
jgi:hypothetical protein